MSLADLIYSKTGIRIGLDSVTVDDEAQTLIASLLALVAKSDGGISLDESLRMLKLLRNRYRLMPGEALNMMPGLRTNSPPIPTSTGSWLL